MIRTIFVLVVSLVCIALLAVGGFAMLGQSKNLITTSVGSTAKVPATDVQVPMPGTDAQGTDESGTTVPATTVSGAEQSSSVPADKDEALGSTSENGQKAIPAAVPPVKFDAGGSAKLPVAAQITHRDFKANEPVVIVVDKQHTQTYAFQNDGQQLFIVYEADNAIGKEESPTPPGPYTVVSKAQQPVWTPPKSIDPKQKKVQPFNKDKNNPLGVAAIRLNKWNIVMHGTNAPSVIGTDASHGCIRHRNDDIERLYKVVDKGTHVIVTDHLEGTTISKGMFK